MLYPSHFRPAVIVVVTIATASLLGACQGSRSDSAAPSPSATVFGHVHGIALNTADETVYVASHNGVFRIVDGTPRLVADRRQDTMGFTISGPDLFLASGHPAPGTTAANPLGLIRSTDRAATWSTLSFGGEEDFHSIDATSRYVYAYSSAGQVLASTDGRTWDPILRAQLIDIAVDPRGPTRLVATTNTGKVIAFSKGKKPSTLPAAPPLAFIDRTATSDIVGADPTGQVFVSTDEGKTWAKRAALHAAPEALSVRADTWFIATETELLSSADNGVTWKPLLKGDS